MYEPISILSTLIQGGSTSNDLYNPDKAFMVYQCDVENYRTEEGEIVSVPTENSTPIGNLVNYSLDESIGPNVYLPQNMTLSAGNSGINNSLMITADKFGMYFDIILKSVIPFFSGISTSFT